MACHSLPTIIDIYRTHEVSLYSKASTCGNVLFEEMSSQIYVTPRQYTYRYCSMVVLLPPVWVTCVVERIWLLPR